MYDFIMLEYGVPLDRDPESDVLIIDNIPHRKGFEQARKYEQDLKNKFMHDAANLVVRFYPIPNSVSKTVVYFHGMQNKGKVREYILYDKPLIDQRTYRFKEGSAHNVLVCW